MQWNPSAWLRPCKKEHRPGLAVLAAFGLPWAGVCADSPPLHFNRLVAHWADYAKPEYLSFIEEARPEIVQVGFYGAHFWSLAHTPHYDGYPAHFPVRGLGPCADWFKELNRRLHEQGVKVIGHFNVEFLVGDPDSPEGPRGFFKFYRDLWDERVLGSKPEPDPMRLLEQNADGSPIVHRSYAIGGMNEYWACLRNPAWQQVLKAWVRHGIELGVDGFIINYFYRHNCLCDHCQRTFKQYLRGRFSPTELEARFAVHDLETHLFPEIVAWHSPEESTPLRLEMLRFSQVSNKAVFDEVFVRYGRSLRPDLILAQWNHLGDFAQISGDERCLLPSDQWGRDEDYLWYSTGDAANYTDLRAGFLGDATLQARYIRSASGNKPFTLGKYEDTRIRVAMAELAANGGAPMGFYTRFLDQDARNEIVRYYRFLQRHEALYRASRPHAEVALIYPRKRVHAGQAGSVETFRKLGRMLLDKHVLFDVIPDDLLSEDITVRYQSVVGVDTPSARWEASLPESRSFFAAPLTVRVSASRPAGSQKEVVLHFVNYNRIEPATNADGRPSRGAGIRDENPIPVAGLQCDFRLPANAKVESVQFLTPEQAEDERWLDPRESDGRIRFTVPKFLVYGVARIRFR